MNTKHTIQIIGLIFVFIAFFMTQSHYGREVIESHESCKLCVKDNVEYRCDCEIINTYQGKIPTEWWIIWGIGFGVTIFGLIYKED